LLQIGSVVDSDSKMCENVSSYPSYLDISHNIDYDKPGKGNRKYLLRLKRSFEPRLQKLPVSVKCKGIFSCG